MTVVPHPCEATKFIWELLFPVGNHAAERARTRDRWPPLRERSPPELRSVPNCPELGIQQESQLALFISAMWGHHRGGKKARRNGTIVLYVFENENSCCTEPSSEDSVWSIAHPFKHIVLSQPFFGERFIKRSLE
jgi:hypothetical protein